MDTRLIFRGITVCWILLSVGIDTSGLLLATDSVDAQSREIRRVIVLTDVGEDPDDCQSLVRLLLYTNDLNIEGIYATANINTGTRVEEIHRRIDAYAKVVDNLRQHDARYPEPESLRAVVRTGASQRSMKSVGAGRSTEASEHMIEVVDRIEDSPIWILAWGAPTDLAQALWDVQNSRSEIEVQRFVRKLRVYDIAGQDESGAWICSAFPDIFYLRSVFQFQAISVKAKRPFPPEVTGPNLSYFDDIWVANNIQNHGPLGALYPPRVYKFEGDTPSFLYLLPNGLSDPEEVHHGNWGGRFNSWKTVNASSFWKEYAKIQKAYEPFRMYTEAPDSWTFKGEHFPNSTLASLFRWREPFQNDFAARMDWTISRSYKNANHNPIAVIGSDRSSQVLYRSLPRGSILELDASESIDPDGDALSFHWWFYPEPGSWKGPLTVQNPRNAKASVQLPKVYSERTIHIVLEVVDDGSPPLTSYRRLIVNVQPR